LQLKTLSLKPSITSNSNMIPANNKLNRLTSLLALSWLLLFY